MSAPFSTVVAALQYRAQHQGDQEAIILRDKHRHRHALTWASLYTLSGRLATVLRRRCHVVRGSLVVNTLPNSAERAVCEVGVWLAGAASVNGVCQLADGSDLLRTVRISGASVLVIDPDVTDGPWTSLRNDITVSEDGDVLSFSSRAHLPDLKKVLFVRRVEKEGKGEEGKGEEGEGEEGKGEEGKGEGGKWEGKEGEGDFLGGLRSMDDGWFHAEDVHPDDMMSVFTTSGTTGFSKLVAHTHGKWARHLQQESMKPYLLTRRVDFSMAPMGWLGGCVAMVIIPGSTRVTCDLRAGIPEDMVQFTWDCLQEEKCTQGVIPPSCLPLLAELAKSQSPQTPALDNLNMLALAGYPIRRSMVEACLALSKTVCVSYGATDFGFVSVCMLTESEGYVDHDTGVPMKGVEVKIVRQTNDDDEDSEDDHSPLPVNTVGQILVKQPDSTTTYLNDPQATAKALTREGFVRTGDVGQLDERGHLLVEGRAGDAVMRGAYIVYPAWLENRLRHLIPGVSDVVIVGVPDPHVHEELCACVIVESDDVSMETVRHSVEKDIVTSEQDPLCPRPRYYLRFESFPVTYTDKLKRLAVREEAVQRLGLSHLKGKV